MNIGQITRNNAFGDMIYKIAKCSDVKNIVEIGTWSGMGSTKCVLDGLAERPTKDYNFTTIELYPDMYEVAKQNLKPYLNDRVKLLNGTIIKPEDVNWFDHSTINFNNDPHARLYYQTDMNYIKTAKNVLSELPDVIDMLILDGGEYTTYPEYAILKERTRIFVLDDTAILKCSRIRKELMDEKVKVLYDNLSNRNGCTIFIKE